jgi:hypothetical protein
MVRRLVQNFNSPNFVEQIRIFLYIPPFQFFHRADSFEFFGDQIFGVLQWDMIVCVLLESKYLVFGEVVGDDEAGGVEFVFFVAVDGNDY